jgi:hypothetical protein
MCPLEGESRHGDELPEATVVKGSEQTKRPVADSLMLWGTAGVVIGLGAVFFWLSDELNLSGRWRLYVLLNFAFWSIMFWRFRSWLHDRSYCPLLIAWLFVHLLVFGFLTYLDFNPVADVFLFPTEAAILIAVGQMLRAKRREKEVHHLKHD